MAAWCTTENFQTEQVPTVQDIQLSRKAHESNFNDTPAVFSAHHPKLASPNIAIGNPIKDRVLRKLY